MTGPATTGDTLARLALAPMSPRAARAAGVSGQALRSLSRRGLVRWSLAGRWEITPAGRRSVLAAVDDALAAEIMAAPDPLGVWP